MDGLENAASAFSDVISGATDSPAPKEQRASGPVESMFDNLGVMEVDDESPAAGGGDRSADPKPKVERKPAVAEIEDEGEESLELPEDGEDDGEGEGADEEGNEEGQDDEEGVEDEDQDVYEVTVDGERVEVGIREALDGYIRQETFNRRLNSLNGFRDELAQHANKVLEQRNSYVKKLEEVDQVIKALIPAEPNWAEEYKKDPEGAAILQKNYNDFQAILAHIGKEKSAISEEERKDNEEAQRNYLARENARILQNHPHWKDEKVRMRDLSAMADTAIKAGFSEEEVLGTTDSRMISLLFKAMKYDRLQANKPKPIRKAGNKPASPGAGSRGTAPKALKSASQQLRKTGSVEDAASVMATLITPSRRK